MSYVVCFELFVRWESGCFVVVSIVRQFSASKEEVVNDISKELLATP